MRYDKILGNQNPSGQDRLVHINSTCTGGTIDGTNMSVPIN